MAPKRPAAPSSPDGVANGSRPAHEPPELLRIPFSHFCRKAEWGLTHAGIRYDTIDTTIMGMRHIKRANPIGRTVPVLRVDDAIIAGSHEILVWADDHAVPHAPPLFPEFAHQAVIDWEQWADNELAPLMRREAYREILRDPRPWARGKLQRFMAPMVARPQFRIAAKHYGVDSDSIEDRHAMYAALARTAEQLRQSPTDFLFAPHPTAADYATAAFWEPMVPVADRTGLAAQDGWDELAAWIRRVKPRRTTRIRKRRVRKSDWERYKQINIRTHGVISG